MILHSLMIAALLGASATPAVSASGSTGGVRSAREPSPPGIRLWTSHGEVYRRGERVRIFFRTELDAYVTIFRVDTDGRVRVLFPREPWEDNYVRGGYTYDVPNYGQHDAFVVDDDPGVGYVFGVASADPFRYDPFTTSEHWDLSLVAYGGRIHGDPYQSLVDLVQRIIPPGYADYDTHLLPYDVERHFDYPRFVCYDCHSYVGYSYWDPYAYWCPRYTLFIYRDPFYFYPSYWYPTRYYGGTRVVYVRPTERGGLYVFKARQDQSAPSVTYRDRRVTDPTFRQPADRGVRGVDLGGVGSIPAPGGRRAIGDQGGAAGAQSGRRAIGDQGGAAPAEGGRRAIPQQTPGGVRTYDTRTPPPPKIEMVPGNGRAPGRRDEPVPVVTPGQSVPSGTPDAPGRRETAPSQGAARQTPRYVQPLDDRPRGVYIDPKTQTGQTPPRNDAERRSEPVYLGRQPQPAGTPQASQPEPRSEPRATPQTERRAEPRQSPPARAQEPRAAPAPRAEPRSSPPPRAEPRSSPPPRAEPRSSPPPRSEPRSSPPPRSNSEGRRRPG
jgi:hypothetical protein